MDNIAYFHLFRSRHGISIKKTQNFFWIDILHLRPAAVVSPINCGKNVDEYGVFVVTFQTPYQYSYQIHIFAIL